MTVGENIRVLRLARGFSQKELGSICGLAEPTIRNYELGNRKVNDRSLKKIAKALGISELALVDRHIDTPEDAMHILFALAEKFGLCTVMGDSDVSAKLDFTKRDMHDYLQVWHKKRAECQGGTISKEELKAWELTFPEQILNQTRMKLDAERKKNQKKDDEKENS